MKSRRRKFLKVKIFYYIIRVLFLFFIKLRYPIQFKGLSKFKRDKVPVILIGNHVSKWDPFILSSAFGRPVCFIASDYVFRNPFIGWLLRSLGAVPKVKFRSDMGSIKRLIDAKNSGLSIGIYPEGHVNWSGRSLDIVNSTGKLVKMLKLPVISVVTSGGYISRPRWAQRKFAPGMTLEFKMLLTGDEIRSMSSDEINTALQQGIAHDEWEYLRSHPRVAPKKRRAENLELSLFACPACSTFGSIESSGNTLRCRSCEAHMEVGSDMFPTNSSFPNTITDIAKWDEWQQKYLENKILESSSEEDLLFKDSPARISIAENGAVFDESAAWGVVGFYSGGIRFSNSASVEFYPLESLSGIAVQNSEELEFYIGNTLARIDFANINISAYKWYSALTIAQKLHKISADF